MASSRAPGCSDSFLNHVSDVKLHTSHCRTKPCNAILSTMLCSLSKYCAKGCNFEHSLCVNFARHADPGAMACLPGLDAAACRIPPFCNKDNASQSAHDVNSNQRTYTDFTLNLTHFVLHQCSNISTADGPLLTQWVTMSCQTCLNRNNDKTTCHTAAGY